MKPDLSLYLVLDPELCGGAHAALDTACTAADAGVSIVQLRAPRWKKRALCELATVLRQRLPAHVPLIINDHVDVALASGACGVHLGQDDLPAAAARAQLGPGRLIGVSAHTPAEILQAQADGADYLGVGPVHATQTKRDTAPVLGLDGLAALMAVRTLPAVAIGGINAGNAGAVMRCGPDGVAVVSALCGQADVAAAARSLRAALSC